MNKPKSIPNWAWEKAISAIGVPEDDTGWHLTSDLLPEIAKVIVSVVKEENEACAKIAASYLDPLDVEKQIQLRQKSMKWQGSGLKAAWTGKDQ